ncbi:MAG: hypothetical protein Q8J89_13910 [Caulobacter sp.]|nr:hypothetical protein [Caulobacter sp.]
MRRIGLILAGLLCSIFVSSPAIADDRLYGFCNITDHSKLSVYSLVYYAVPEQAGDFEPAYLERVGSKYVFSGDAHSYCLHYQTKAEAEAAMVKMAAGDSGRQVVHDASDPSKLPPLSGPTLTNAKAFLKEVLLNGVSRVHLMRATDTMVSDGYLVKDVGGGRCTSRITYVGDWFGRPSDNSLVVDWTKAVDVSPFFSDPSRSHIKVLAATTEERMGVVTSISGVSINPGSEDLEMRLTKALKVIVEACRPKSSTGF